MKLEGEKIVLRTSRIGEVEAFTRWMNDPKVTRHLGPIHGKNITLEEEKKWLLGVLADSDELIFSMYKVEGDKLIGNCGIHFNAKREDDYAGNTFLGLAIGERGEWGKGHGTEAIQLMLQYLEQEGHSEVYLTVDEENLAARSVYKKCGFEILVKQLKDTGEGEEYIMKWTKA